MIFYFYLHIWVCVFLRIVILVYQNFYFISLLPPFSLSLSLSLSHSANLSLKWSFSPHFPSHSRFLLNFLLIFQSLSIYVNIYLLKSFDFDFLFLPTHLGLCFFKNCYISLSKLYDEKKDELNFILKVIISWWDLWIDKSRLIWVFGF